MNEAGLYAVQYIHATNAKVNADERVAISPVPMTDGITLAREP